MLRQMAQDPGLLLGDAAKAIGVSPDTLRRWERAGKLRTDARLGQPPARAARARWSACRGGPTGSPAGDSLSARNRFPGVVRSVEIDGVMALVEIEAGPHRIVAAITRDAVEELGLAPGVPGHRGREGDVGDGGARVRRLALLLGAGRAGRRRAAATTTMATAAATALPSRAWWSRPPRR